MVEVSIGGWGEFQCTEADVIEGFIIDAEGLVSIFNQLMHWESCIVRLNNGVRNLKELE